MRLREIVVGVELSDADRSSLLRAASLARPLRARVTLLNVDEVSRFGFRSSEELDAYLTEIAARRQRRLDAERDQIESAGVEVKTVSVPGDPAEEIAKFALAQGADLVIVGRRGSRAPHRIVLGHAAKRLLRHCEVPLLLTADEASEAPLPARLSYRRVLAATDFSEPSELGLRATLALAEQLDAEVDYVHVIRLPIAIPAVPSEPPLLVPRESGEQLRRARAEELAAVVDRIGSPRCTPSVVLGANVAETLASTATELGDALITIPSHGHSRLRETLFGSTAEHVVKIAPVPVLVFPSSWLRQNSLPV